MYPFLPHLSFSVVRHFVLPTISSLILFFTFDITFSFTCFFYVDFLFPVCLFQSPRFQLSAILFCRKCCCNYFFLVLLSSSLFFFLHHYSLCYTTSMSYIVFFVLQVIPFSINISVNAILTGSLNILFKAFPCILSISFISSFFMYPLLGVVLKKILIGASQ